jgi:hypothetical protein
MTKNRDNKKTRLADALKKNMSRRKQAQSIPKHDQRKVEK